jgi:hypothetical protein
MQQTPDLHLRGRLLLPASLELQKEFRTPAGIALKGIREVDLRKECGASYIGNGTAAGNW